jgi:hypothetical protein
LKVGSKGNAYGGPKFKHGENLAVLIYFDNGSSFDKIGYRLPEKTSLGTNTLRERNSLPFNLKTSGTHNYHCRIKG